MIIYFSGTGNSLTVAKAVASQLNEKAVSMAEAIKHPNIEDEMVGIVSPVHNYDIPRFVKEYIKLLYFRSAKYIFAIITHGGDRGNSIYSIQKLLEQKGLILNYYNDLLMPVNSRIMYGRVTDKIEERIDSALIKVKDIVEDIKGNKQKREFLSQNYFLNLMHNIIEKESIRVRFTPEVDSHLCIKCGICAKVCPSNNITFGSDSAIINSNCHQCTNCLHWCPQVAIHYRKRDIRKEQQYHCIDVTAVDVAVR